MDLESLASLFMQCFSAAPWNEPWTSSTARARLDAMIRCDTCRGVVAIEFGDFIGMAFGQIEFWHDGNLFLLQEVCVAPAHQGRGVGRQMLSSLASQIAGDDGIREVYLLTDRSGPAIEFYIKLGLRESKSKVVVNASIDTLRSLQRGC